MVKDEAEISKSYILFIDVLYAVVVGETIFEYGDELFINLSLSTFALVVIYISIISSFIFWHRGITKYPHKAPYRFFVDIGILITYLGIVFNHCQIDRVLFGFIILYTLYLVWDCLARSEYGKEVSRLKSSIVNLFSVIMVYVVYQALSLKLGSSQFIDIGALIVLLVIIVITQIRDIKKVAAKSIQNQ